MKRWRGLSAALLALLLAAPGQSQTAGPVEFALDRVDRDLEHLRREEHSLKRALDLSSSEQARLQERIRLRGRAYYRLSRASPSGDLFEYAVRLERVRAALLRDMARVDKLAATKKQTDRGLRALQARRAPLEVEVLAAGRARDALLAQSEREQAFELAFSSSRGASHTAIYSAGADLDAPGQSFTGMKGRLPFPVPGRAEVEAVRRPYAQGAGLLMHTFMGAPARAVFPGRVAFADDYPQYGKTVILDHGDGYFTVTAELSSLDVHSGEDLPAGARLGVTGTAGVRGTLYFEVRHHTETLEPGQWFGI